MSRTSYGKAAASYSSTVPKLTLKQFIRQLPHVTISEIEAMAETNTHLVEQIPRYISQMVSHECRLIGF
ncbi:hypothetical protein C9426_29055 [Serratia sp. S1B]|nr:hypothetical protein C9426_29055 [Serratia sp. S1B]